MRDAAAGMSNLPFLVESPLVLPLEPPLQFRRKFAAEFDKTKITGSRRGAAGGFLFLSKPEGRKKIAHGASRAAQACEDTEPRNGAEGRQPQRSRSS